MPQRGTRDATHAGSWYESRPEALSRQLDGFLEKVPTTIEGKHLPIPKSRVIIAPYVLFFRAYMPSCPPRRLIVLPSHPLQADHIHLDMQATLTLAPAPPGPTSLLTCPPPSAFLSWALPTPTT